MLTSAALGLVLSASGSVLAEDSAAASLYVRGDTDETTVISPKLRVRAEAAQDTHVDLSYTVDVWTSASVDIVASASQPVTEQRDELNLGLDHAFDDITIGGGYRFSGEPDYASHGGSAFFSIEMANNAAKLDLKLAGSSDTVSRAGDDAFGEEVSTLTAGAAFTQVIDTETVVQGLYDLTNVQGYQASAYRYVAIGGDGRCFGAAPLCVPERNPRERLRHALAVRARRALASEWSGGAGYRFYLDDWGVTSSTVRGDVAWAPTRLSTIALTYRFYTQGAADHYKSVYPLADQEAAYLTSDKELSPLSSHRVAIELDYNWELGDGLRALSTAITVAPTFYQYTDFVPYERITAIEATAAVGMVLE